MPLCWRHDIQHNDTRHTDISFKCRCAECRYAKCQILIVILNAIMLNVVAPSCWLTSTFSVKLLSCFIVILNIVMVSVIFMFLSLYWMLFWRMSLYLVFVTLNVVYAESCSYCNAECLRAECSYTLSRVWYSYAECRQAERRYVECRDPVFDVSNFFPFLSTKFVSMSQKPVD